MGMSDRISMYVDGRPIENSESSFPQQELETEAYEVWVGNKFHRWVQFRIEFLFPIPNPLDWTYHLT